MIQKLETKNTYLSPELSLACSTNNLKEFQTVLIDQEFKNSENCFILFDSLITQSCKHDSLDIIKYITTDLQLKEKITKTGCSIESIHELSFLSAFSHDKKSIISFCLDELNLPINNSLKKKLTVPLSDSGSPIDELNRLIKQRDINYKCAFENIKKPLEDVKILLTYYPENTIKNSDGFEMAYENNRLDIIDYIVSSSRLNKCLSARQIEIALEHACENENIELLDILFKIPSIKINTLLTDACRQNTISTLIYLTNKSDINQNNDEALMTATTYGHIEVLKCLLSSPELTKHSNIDAREGQAFINLCKHNHTKGIEFFLYDLNYQVPEKTKSTLDRLSHTPLNTTL